MIGGTTTTTWHPERITKAVDKGAYRNFFHAAASIAKTAKASIKTDDEPSEPGEPPHTKAERGHNLRLAIRFDATKEDAYIGPRASIVGEAGAIHEFGLDDRGNFPERPFMQPALLDNLSRFSALWAGSIGG